MEKYVLMTNIAVSLGTVSVLFLFAFMYLTGRLSLLNPLNWQWPKRLLRRFFGRFFRRRKDYGKGEGRIFDHPTIQDDTTRRISAPYVEPASPPPPPPPPPVDPPERPAQEDHAPEPRPQKLKTRKWTRKTTATIFSLLLFTLFFVALFVAIQTKSWRILVLMLAPTVSFLALMLIAYSGGKYSMWFTYVKSGTARVVVTGPLEKNTGSFNRLILNVRGYYFNQVTRKIEPVTKDGEDACTWFTELTNLYFVSWLYPMKHVYSFDIFKTRLKKNRGKIIEMSEKIEIDDHSTTVDFLLWEITRPFYLKELDLVGDNTKIDILGKGIYTIYDPELMLFFLDGKFLEEIDSVANAYLISRFRSLSYVDMESAKSDLNPEHLNGSDDPSCAAYKNAFNMRAIAGVTCIAFLIEEFSASAGDPEMDAAREAESIALKKAEAARATAKGVRDTTITLAEGVRDARIIEAEGDAQYIERLATAEGTRASLFVRSLTSTLVHPNTAGLIFRDRHKFENLQNLGTYVESGSNTPVLLQENRRGKQDPRENPAEEQTPADISNTGTESSAANRKPKTPPKRNKGGYRKR